MLFQKLETPDRTKTQLAYAAQYMPWKELTSEAERLIVWRHAKHMYKHQIQQLINPEQTHLQGLKNRHSEFKIVWAYNAIPTELEWTKKSSGFILHVDYRVLKDIGQVVQLSFY